MKRTTILLGVWVCFLFSSCSLFSKNLAKRYRNTQNSSLFAKSSDPLSFVQVDVNSSVVKETPATPITYNVLSLTEDGQQAFIGSLNQQSPANPTQFMDLLTTNFSFSKDAKPAIKIIPKTIRKSIVFTIDRLQYQNNLVTNRTIFNNIGDRVAYLELNINIPAAAHVVFDSWDKYVTDHMTLNLGKVTSAQQWNASLSLNAKGTGEMSLSGSNSTEGFESNKTNESVTLVNTGQGGSGNGTNTFELINTDKGTKSAANSLKAGTELGGSATVGFSDKYETSLDLTSRILKLSGTLADKKLLLRQESGPGIDLSGNVVVSVDYAITDDWAAPAQFLKLKGLYTSNRPNTVANIQVGLLTVIFPDIRHDITGDLEYSFLYRQVQKGNRHLPEARQKVKFWYGGLPHRDRNGVITPGRTFTLLRTTDVRPKSYSIKSGAHMVTVNNLPLTFETVTEAAACLRYISDLVLRGVSLAGLAANAVALTPATAGGLTIETIQL